MTVSVTRIIECMEQLDQLHIKLLELGEIKKRHIIKNDVNELISVLNQERIVTKEIEEQESHRMDAVYSFLKERGIKSKLSLTVTELLRLVFNVEEKHQLKEAQMKLSGRLKAVKYMNDLNKQLIQQALDYTNYTLDLLAVHTTEQEPTYQNPQDKNLHYGKSGFFDSRV